MAKSYIGLNSLVYYLDEWVYSELVLNHQAELQQLLVATGTTAVATGFIPLSEGESNVYTIEQQRIDYGADRLQSMKGAKEKDLRAKFNMDADQLGPKNIGQVLDAFKEGKITFKEVPNEVRDYRAVDTYGRVVDYSFLNFFDFRDPSAPKPDKDGFAKAKDSLNAEYKKSMDAITFAKDADAQLKVLQAFESTTIN